jgi:alkylhydroperoxidase/carboxymuconolactone decarboxylase family protein YurZ
MTVDVEPAAAEFQDYLTTVARRVWARGDVLTRRDRSLLVMAMTAALARMEEFRLHLEAVEQHGLPASIGAVTASVWQQFATVEPGADFTRIYPFVQGSA